MKLHHGKFALDVRKKFLTSRVTGHWNRFPRKVGHNTKPVRVQAAS